MPDPTLTPGAILGVTKKDVCQPGYAKSVRDVSDATKARVFELYHVNPKVGGPYEVDHLVSLELGGSNAIENLWPQPYVPKPGAREKDTVENDLHKRVCAGQISLKKAQSIIAKNWLGYYEQLHGQSHVSAR